jgi:hypothetical protein
MPWSGPARESREWPSRPSPATAGKIVLIWAEAGASATSLLTIRTGPAVESPATYVDLAAALLGSRADLSVRLRMPPAADGHIANNCEGLLRLYSERLKLVDEGAELELIARQVDILVAFASAAVIQACRQGLKPVQIGDFLIGSEAFTHIFGSVGDFVAMMAARRIGGSLTLKEHSEFGFFCRASPARARSLAVEPRGGFGALRWLRALWRIARDPVLRECRRGKCGRQSAVRTISGALANPFAAWRLLYATYRERSAA